MKLKKLQRLMLTRVSIRPRFTGDFKASTGFKPGLSERQATYELWKLQSFGLVEYVLDGDGNIQTRDGGESRYRITDKGKAVLAGQHVPHGKDGKYVLHV